MAPDTRWWLLPLAFGLGSLMPAAFAEQHRPDSAYHQEFRTAPRPDAPQVGRAPAWGMCCDGQADRWREDDAFRDTAPRPQWWAEHRPDPNRRRIEVPAGDAERGWSPDGIGGGGGRGQDERARRGWRAGWRGAEPGRGGVWWYGWGGDWPAYAGDWEPGRWSSPDREWRHSGRSGRRGEFHGEFGFEQGWSGGRVIALPAPRGD